MRLNLEEKEKLLNKATKLYDEIKGRKFKQNIDLDITRKYYDSGSRYSNFGFKYYLNGSMCCFGEDIKDSLENLKHYVEFKKGIGEEYINGKSVDFISQYTINALLDFIYNGDYITDIKIPVPQNIGQNYSRQVFSLSNAASSNTIEILTRSVIVTQSEEEIFYIEIPSGKVKKITATEATVNNNILIPVAIYGIL